MASLLFFSLPHVTGRGSRFRPLPVVTRPSSHIGSSQTRSLWTTRSPGSTRRSVRARTMLYARGTVVFVQVDVIKYTDEEYKAHLDYDKVRA